MREASEVLPKPMLPIGGKPIMWHIMKGFASFGVKDFVLCLGYKGWVIKEFFLNYREMVSDLTIKLDRRGPVVRHGTHDEEDWTITLAETGDHTQTGGRVAAVRRYVEGDEPFLVTYGDGVADLNVRELLDFHRTHGRIATVTAVRPPGRFGEMELEGTHVTEFNEKSQVRAGFINGGFFVFDGRRIWDYLGAEPGVVLENEPLRRLTREGELIAFRHTGFWQAMDTLREYTMLNDLWASDKGPWKTWS
jgi:glucose-1-phosphate cytidylyltransferase